MGQRSKRPRRARARRRFGPKAILQPVAVEWPRRQIPLFETPRRRVEDGTGLSRDSASKWRRRRNRRTSGNRMQRVPMRDVLAQAIEPSRRLILDGLALGHFARTAK